MLRRAAEAAAAAAADAVVGVELGTQKMQVRYKPYFYFNMLSSFSSVQMNGEDFCVIYSLHGTAVSFGGVEEAVAGKSEAQDIS